MISRKSIEEVTETAQIEQVVQDFVRLKRRGSNLIGLCPFHTEKTPSFVVSPSKNIYKCFGCGRAGGSVQFVMEHEQYTFPEAIRYLAERYSIELEETQRTEDEVKADQERESLYILNAFVSAFYRNNLVNTEEGRSVALSYLKERGFRKDVMERYELGYAPKSGVELKKAALKKGFKSESMTDAGLLNKSGRDFFWERVIFPIHNLSGKVIAFAGRIIGKKEKAPKYINSPETEIYNKSKILYGLYQAKREIKREDECLLVEGYTDVMMLSQQGIEHVVATSGTALTEGQIALIKRFTSNVTLLFDGDAAGIKAAERGVNLMIEKDINVKVVVLPEGEDPDSYLRKVGSSGFREFITANAKDFILFKADQLLDGSTNDPVKKVALIRDLVETLSLITDAVKRSVYVQECARQFDVDEQLLVNELNKSIKKRMWQKRKRQMDESSRRESSMSDPSMPEYIPEAAPSVHSDVFQERDIVRILIVHGHKWYDEAEEITLGEYVLSQIRDVIDHVEDPLYSKILDIYIDAIAENHTITSTYFIQHEDPEVQKAAIDLSSEEFQYSENWEERWEIVLQTQRMPEQNFLSDANNAIMRLKLKKIEVVIKENAQMIANASDEDERDRYLMVHHELVDTRNKIAHELNTTVL